MNNRFIRYSVLALFVCLFGAFAQAVGVFSSASSRVTDQFFHDRQTHKQIVMVSIDDASLQRIGRWPWDRAAHAELIRRLHQEEVKAIGYDVNFAESSNEASDRDLADAMKESGKVVLPVELKQNANTVKPYSLFGAQAAATGFTNLPLDDDNIARRIPLTYKEQDGSSVHAFALETLRIAGVLPSSIPTDQHGQLIIHYPGKPGSIESISAADLLQGNRASGIVKDKIVFIGATARDLHDEQLVPTSEGIPMSGVEIHASIADTVLSGAYLKVAPISWMALLYLVLFLIGIALSFLRMRWSIALTLVTVTGLSILGILCFDQGVVVSIFWPIITTLLLFVSSTLYRYITSEKEKSELTTIFGRYVSPAVVASIVKDPSKVRLGGDRRRMTVLFSDLRGFTAMSEGLSPEQLVEVLNLYLDEMTKIVFEQGGVLDKYIGDAVMAFWNAPMNQEDHAKRAVRCALAMTKRLQEMNQDGAFLNKLQLNVGVGMNTGEMVVGNIGSSLRHDYTVIGDSVNLASRTESLCKDYGCKVIVTKNTLDEIGDEFFTRELDQVAVKGKKEPIRIYEVIGTLNEASEAQRLLVKAYGDALALYYSQRFTEAKQAFTAIVASSSDVASQLFVERCAEYEQNPPPANWDGTSVRKGK